jgi:hypothetical protein
MLYSRGSGINPDSKGFLGLFHLTTQTLNPKGSAMNKYVASMIALAWMFAFAPVSAQQTTVEVETFRHLGSTAPFVVTTSNPGEVNLLFQNGWTRDSKTFHVWVVPEPGMVPVCHFSIRTPDKQAVGHFYTANDSECAEVAENPAWEFVNIAAFWVYQPQRDARTDAVFCPSGTSAVSRYYNVVDGTPNHLYLPDFYKMKPVGLVFEGIVFCAESLRGKK